MRLTSVREFRDGATRLLRTRDPILITRRGRLAGIFFPRPEASLPLELKREIFPALAAEVSRQPTQLGAPRVPGAEKRALRNGSESAQRSPSGR